MSKTIKLRKGFDIRLQGEAEKVFAKYQQPTTFAICPNNFRGIIPKLLVEVGDKVKAGTPLFFDKNNPDMKFTAPVSGEISAINRGEKRVIEEIVISADSELKYEKFATSEAKGLSREDIIKLMLSSGTWAFLRERPFNKIANPTRTPKAIVISAFDTAPLAADNDFIVHGYGKEFQAGIDAISKLTDGKVHLNMNAREKASDVFTNTKGVQHNYFAGPHPAGNVGVQIHHLDPINKGEYVWYLNPQDVLAVGRFFLEGRFNTERIVALAGSEVKSRKYFKTHMGACIDTMVKGNVSDEKLRYISGNILTGDRINDKGYLGFYDSQITVAIEGDDVEFFGWLRPGFDRPSNSRALFSYLLPGKKFRANTNMRGEERAFVMTGEYEKVLPMDVYPLHLLKAIMYEDIEEIEGLGIYEVVEEDFALCEFVCTSKFPVQEVLRKGLDLIERECF